jgi:hypothetical protein
MEKYLNGCIDLILLNCGLIFQSFTFFAQQTYKSTTDKVGVLQ